MQKLTRNIKYPATLSKCNPNFMEHEMQKQTNFNMKFSAQYLVSPAKFHVKLRKIDCSWDSAPWEQPKRPLKQLVSVAVSGGGSGNRHPHFPSNPIFMQGFVPAGFPIQYSPFAKRTKIIFILTQMTVSEELGFVRTCAMNPTKSNKIFYLQFSHWSNLSGPEKIHSPNIFLTPWGLIPWAVRFVN